MTTKPVEIALCLSPSVGYFTDVLLGIQEFARQHPAWVTEIVPGFEATRETLKRWRPHGLLVERRWNEDWDPLIRGYGGPVVQLGGQTIEGVPRVSTDNDAIGQLAAEHFLQRGFRNFAFAGYEMLEWSREREAGFRGALAKAGFTYEKFPDQEIIIHANTVGGNVGDWLAAIRKPVAIFTCHDRCAMLLSKSCEVMNLRIPEEVAILGVDNNVIDCMLPQTPLSSVMGSARRVGYEAASLLERSIRGDAVKAQTYLIPPAGVMARQSTDVLAIADPDLAAAMRFISARAGTAIQVEDVASEVVVTRRMLERKFRSILKRSPREEILRAHLERAKDLLVRTQHSVLQVALQSGFPSSSKFASVFRRVTGMTPTEFRDRYGMQVR